MAFNQPFNAGKRSQEQFSMIPRADVPRSVFRQKSGHKTTFDASYLVPVYLNEILPGDTVRMSMTAFARMQPAIYPLMDNLYMDSFWFFVPCRLVWSNWKYFMGEAPTFGLPPTTYTIPVMASADMQGAPIASLSDYFGLPSTAQIGAGFLNEINALPFRAYSLIYDEWFRDENVGTRVLTSIGDGPDIWAGGTAAIQRRNKKRDYFTSALPWPQKGVAATIPIAGLAPIQGLSIGQSGLTVNAGINVQETARGALAYPFSVLDATGGFRIQVTDASASADPLVYADLSQATNATIEALRYANMLQTFMERDARGGTRYTEILRSHFGVVSPDARLQRPEYLGGGSTPISINPVAQTSETATTPLGQLAGVGTGVHSSGFSQSFTEHGYIIGIVNVRADLTYQQGFHKLWSRRTKYDFYWPEFAHLGEQAILRKEIYAVGTALDDQVFGYQERWGEYRYFPSKITGKFRSGVAGTLNAWHLAQEFSAPPVIGQTFLTDAPPMTRVLAAGAGTDTQQFLFDSVFDANYVRPVPTYSVPGLGGRF